MKLLVIGNYYEPEVTSGIYMVKNLYEHLAESGVEVEVVIPSPSRGISKEQVEDYYGKDEILKDGKLHLHRIKIFPEGHSTLGRAIRYILIQLRLYKAAKRICADVVFCQSTPPIIGITASVIAKQKKIPFVYNLHDVFPDSMVNAGMTHEGSWIFRVGRIIENYVYKNAVHIIAVSKGIQDNVIQKGFDPNKVSVVSNWVDEEVVHFVPREKNELIRRWNLDPTKFYAVYAGNLGTSQNIDVILDAAAITQDEDNILFLIIGNGVEEERLKKKAMDLRLKNVMFFPMQPYKDVSYVYSLGDVDIVTCKPGVGTAGMPSKTWSIMATGRPLLVCFDDHSELRGLIDEIEAGLCVDPKNAEGLAKNIKYLAENHVIREKMGENGRRYIDNNLTKRICVEKYYNILMRAVGNS